MHAHVRATGEAVDLHTLEAHGIPARHVGTDPAVFQPVLDELKQKSGYGTQDEVKLSKDTPNLAVALKKFDDEHLHTDDEIRFIVSGACVFDVRGTDDRMIRIVVEAGDLMVVPAGRYHRFELTDACAVHAIRLFKDPAGWVPEYRQGPPAP